MLSQLTATLYPFSAAAPTAPCSQTAEDEILKEESPGRKVVGS